MRKLHISEQGFKDFAASQMNVAWDFIEIHYKWKTHLFAQGYGRCCAQSVGGMY